MEPKFLCICHHVMSVGICEQRFLVSLSSGGRFLRIFLTRVDLVKQSSLGLVSFVVRQFMCSLHLVCSMSTGRKASVPFDGRYFPVFKDLGCMMQWHPRIPEDKLPLWLKEYVVTHFIGVEPMELNHLVHLLFHDHFQDPVDRLMILLSLRLCNTLAVSTPDKGTVIYALMFVECCKEPCNIAIVLILATDPSFVCVGMGSLLLDLVFHDLHTPNNGCNGVVLLKVNKKGNPNAYNYYKHAGLNEVGGMPSFTAELSSAFAKKGCPRTLS